MNKKTFSIVALGGLLAIAGACTTDDGTVSSAGNVEENKTLDGAATDTTEATAPAKTSFALGEIAETADGTKLVARAAQKVTGEFFEPDPGNEYRAVDIEGCAGPAVEGFSLNPFEFEMKLADNTRTGPDFGVKEPSLNHTELDPGECVRGWITFEVPKGASGLSLVYEEISFFGGTKITWTL